MDLRQLHQLKCELLKVYRYQGLTLQELLCEFYSHINEVINSTNGLIDIVDYLVGEGLSNEVATHLNQMLIDGTFDKIISNKVDELSTNLNNQFNEMKKIIESNISESNNLIENLRVYDSRFNNIENKNIEQDNRLKDVENKNKVQDVYINGLFNENKDGRLCVEGEGNDLKLEGSKQGLVEIEKVVGNTFVNYYTFKTKDDFFSIASNVVINEHNLKFTANGIYQNAMLKPISTLKTSTEYTVVVNVLKNTLNSHMIISRVASDTQLSINAEINPNYIGIKTYKVTSNSDFTNCTRALVTFLTNTATEGEIELNIMILEGDYTNKPIPTQHIEGLQSSFESNQVTQEMVNEGLESEENLGKYKVPVRLIGKNKFNSEIEIGIQLEEGTVATDREDYFERTTNVYLNSPLLEGDEIVWRNGELCHYHKRSKVVLDGSNDEGIQFATNWSSNADIVIFTNSITSNVSYADKNKNYLIADNVLTDTYNQWVVYKNGVNKISVQESSTSGNRLLWSLPKDKYTLDSFKQKLQSSPTTIVYELAEPYYEPIQADKILLECANDSTIHLDTVVPVESVKASYTGKIPNAYQMDEDIDVTQTAVDFLLMSSMGEVMMMSFNENTRGGNNMGAYFASRIIKKALKYEDVIRKYPEFKDDIDFILRSEGYEYLIK